MSPHKSQDYKVSAVKYYLKSKMRVKLVGSLSVVHEVL